MPLGRSLNTRSATRRLTYWTLSVLDRLFVRLKFVSTLWFRLMRFRRKVTIAYICKDDAELVAIAYRYYSRLGVPIRIFMDDKSRNESLKQLRAWDIPFELVANPSDYVEPLHKEVSARVDTPWLLIVNNDELLNVRALIETSIRVYYQKGFTCFGISRRWLMMHNGNTCIGSAEFMGPDYQYRLVRHREVTFHDQIHTAGFDLPNPMGFLSPQACLYHFDWIVRTKEQRQSKLDFYETKLTGARSTYLKWYLPEDFLEDYELRPVEDSAISAVIPEYRSESGAVAPTRAL